MEAKNKELTPTEKADRISVRTDEKRKFALDFAVAVTGQSQKKIVETALDAALKEKRLPNKTNWLDYWDPESEVRALRLLFAEDYPSTAEDDMRRVFINEYRDFFFVGEHPRRDYLRVFWPRVDELAAKWRDRRFDMFAVMHSIASTECLPDLLPDNDQRY